MLKFAVFGFPPIFERIWAGEFQPWGLAFVCQRPHTYFVVADSPPLFPRFKWCVPLWEENGDCIVAYDKATGEFISHFLEDAEPDILGTNYQQFVSHFFIGLAESGFDEFPQFAELFGYRHLEEFKRLIHTDYGDNFAACHEATRKFIESITDEDLPRSKQDGFYEKH